MLGCTHPAALHGARPPCKRDDCGHSATALLGDGGSGISWFAGPVRRLSVAPHVTVEQFVDWVRRSERMRDGCFAPSPGI
jgi:hypothetical protein